MQQQLKENAYKHAPVQRMQTRPSKKGHLQCANRRPISNQDDGKKERSGSNIARAIGKPPRRKRTLPYPKATAMIARRSAHQYRTDH
jgi:hypothetical protein